MVEVNLATIGFGDIDGFKGVVSVCHIYMYAPHTLSITFMITSSNIFSLDLWLNLLLSEFCSISESIVFC